MDLIDEIKSEPIDEIKSEPIDEIKSEPIDEFDSNIYSTSIADNGVTYRYLSSICSAELDIKEECDSNTVTSTEEQSCIFSDSSDDSNLDSEKDKRKLTYSSDWSSIVELLERRSLDDIRLYFDKCKKIAKLEIEVLNKRLEEAKTNINNIDLICKLEEQIQNLKEQIEKI